ncbi:MAG: LamG domain-containing protein, partial [Myxococcota bacterium]|nr:LamG domain-containing protein [Myxococcota bacterium]
SEPIDDAAVSLASPEATTQSGLDATGGDRQDHYPITNGGTGLDVRTTSGDGASGLDGTNATGDGSATAVVVTANSDSAAAPDSPVAGGNDAALPDAGTVSTLGMGLVALYLFDETSGTTSADASGNNAAATLHGATFTPGLVGNAVDMNGGSQYVALPPGIMSVLKSFSVSAWVNARSSAPQMRVFDFGTGTTVYMFFTPFGATGPGRYAISTTGTSGHEIIQAPAALPTGIWQHVVVTMTGATGTLYVGGAQVAQSTALTLTAASLGNTTRNWLGRSQFVADAYLDGQIDNFRIYNRALTASEVLQLFQQQL